MTFLFGTILVLCYVILLFGVYALNKFGADGGHHESLLTYCFASKASATTCPWLITNGVSKP